MSKGKCTGGDIFAGAATTVSYVDLTAGGCCMLVYRWRREMSDCSVPAHPADLTASLTANASVGVPAGDMLCVTSLLERRFLSILKPLKPPGRTLFGAWLNGTLKRACASDCMLSRSVSEMSFLKCFLPIYWKRCSDCWYRSEPECLDRFSFEAEPLPLCMSCCSYSARWRTLLTRRWQPVTSLEVASFSVLWLALWPSLCTVASYSEMVSGMRG